MNTTKQIKSGGGADIDWINSEAGQDAAPVGYNK